MVYIYITLMLFLKLELDLIKLFIKKNNLICPILLH